MRIPDRVEDGAAFFYRRNNSRSGQKRQMPGNHGKIDQTTLGQLADRTWPPALGEAAKEF